jgi:hypothetical protein
VRRLERHPGAPARRRGPAGLGCHRRHQPDARPRPVPAVRHPRRHAWDIAVATGQPSPLTPELAGPLLDAARTIVEPLRGWGAYAPELAAEPGDGPVEALLRYLGRDPRWS